jgi:hypothetical protein
MDEVRRSIEIAANATPSAIEFEMAYQARVAIDRIRFAIKHTEIFGAYSDQTREVGLQLLDALQRLEAIDRQFQRRSRNSLYSRISGTTNGSGVDEDGTSQSQDQPHHRVNHGVRGNSSA